MQKLFSKSEEEGEILPEAKKNDQMNSIWSFDRNYTIEKKIAFFN